MHPTPFTFTCILFVSGWNMWERRLSHCQPTLVALDVKAHTHNVLAARLYVPLTSQDAQPTATSPHTGATHVYGVSHVLPLEAPLQFSHLYHSWEEEHCGTCLTLTHCHL